MEFYDEGEHNIIQTPRTDANECDYLVVRCDCDGGTEDCFLRLYSDLFFSNEIANVDFDEVEIHCREGGHVAEANGQSHDVGGVSCSPVL